MAEKGMDVDQVLKMAKQLSSAAEDITTMQSDLTTGLEEVDWTGPDADDFRGTWESEMVPALKSIQTAVEQLGATAESNASEQQTVSSH
ncbi:WXG100 family type VII secretion target [Brachybacterium subflavum]|uniref:WXG100 family type VII secretion target n=1 Tax=Brachybacterium subflavum TaxID=2585206 RepID=UPI001D0D17D6|nr:WXG100 family type VII secretion target [Brachybacterium subflavum]